MPIRREQNLLADGRRRLAAVHLPQIEGEIRARYTSELESASGPRRWWIELRIRLEIRRALSEAAPAAGLY